ncbi:MAG: Yqey-like protein [bacterium ADurb.Bin363]|nr:MAG: Yqey-like protein [bacterium ADurb.Bin363]
MGGNTTPGAISIEVKLSEDMKVALKENNKLKLSVIRYTRNAIQKYQKDNIKKELSYEEVQNILTSEVKKRRDSIQVFREGGRKDLAIKEEKELEILLEYLPKQLSRDELKELIKVKLLEIGAKGKKDFGRAMKIIIPILRSQADGNVVKEIVQEELAN